MSIETDIEVIKNRLERLEKEVTKLDLDMNNGIKKWIAKTGAELTYIYKEQEQQDECDKEILERMNALEKLVEKLVVKMGFVYTVIMVVVVAAINLLLK